MCPLNFMVTCRFGAILGREATGLGEYWLPGCRMGPRVPRIHVGGPESRLSGSQRGTSPFPCPTELFFLLLPPPFPPQAKLYQSPLSILWIPSSVFLEPSPWAPHPYCSLMGRRDPRHLLSGILASSARRRANF